MAAATAPPAKGRRKNEPATAISPTANATAAASQIHRQVSGEPKSINAPGPDVTSGVGFRRGDGVGR